VPVRAWRFKSSHPHSSLAARSLVTRDASIAGDLKAADVLTAWVRGASETMRPSLSAKSTRGSRTLRPSSRRQMRRRATETSTAQSTRWGRSSSGTPRWCVHTHVTLDLIVFDQNWKKGSNRRTGPSPERGLSRFSEQIYHKLFTARGPVGIADRSRAEAVGCYPVMSMPVQLETAPASTGKIGLSSR
jgi:hypothetical protein